MNLICGNALQKLPVNVSTVAGIFFNSYFPIFRRGRIDDGDNFRRGRIADGDKLAEIIGAVLHLIKLALRLCPQGHGLFD